MAAPCFSGLDHTPGASRNFFKVSKACKNPSSSPSLRHIPFPSFSSPTPCSEACPSLSPIFHCCYCFPHYPGSRKAPVQGWAQLGMVTAADAMGSGGSPCLGLLLQGLSRVVETSPHPSPPLSLSQLSQAPPSQAGDGFEVSSTPGQLRKLQAQSAHIQGRREVDWEGTSAAQVAPPTLPFAKSWISP